MLIMIIAPKIHDKIAAGPATFAAVPAPNNHPEPIKEFKASITPENSVIFWNFIFSIS